MHTLKANPGQQAEAGEEKKERRTMEVVGGGEGAALAKKLAQSRGDEREGEFVLAMKERAHNPIGLSQPLGATPSTHQDKSATNQRLFLLRCSQLAGRRRIAACSQSAQSSLPHPPIHMANDAVDASPTRDPSPERLYVPAWTSFIALDTTQDKCTAAARLTDRVDTRSFLF
ncbi:hypothetical protein EV356DRAFT_529532 [Viridothelium virens]|uniref:Uncharacterized protein n=1 Tax=Viridothelium virens TaxID=1048519 RepID=A0A6A6HJ18_VIRVR|nr:hypothetical protein EV356DRAFT_529532 [Viridothelium virens]